MDIEQEQKLMTTQNQGRLDLKALETAKPPFTVICALDHGYILYHGPANYIPSVGSEIVGKHEDSYRVKRVVLDARNNNVSINLEVIPRP